MPIYSFNDFKECCITSQNDVIPLDKVLDDAKKFFGLRTKKELLNFIGNDGLEDLHFVNTKEWENNPNKSFPMFIDAYEFRSMYKLGYIAFMRNETTKKWLIKSFHPSINKNISMAMALYKSGLIGEP